MSLCGDWAFRLHPSADHLSTDVADPGFDDRQWERVEVPCHWPLLGDGEFGRPIYTNVQFPFPIDPPHVPDANPTADHRRHFDYPGWDVDRVLLRFDGVESVYRVWLNGTEVGVGKGSRLVQEFDVTDAVRVGDNVVVVRVHQWSSMSYVEDQDQWWLPGIFRDVTLLGRPAGRIDDIWLQTGYRADGTGWLRADVRGPGQAFPVTVEIPELGFRQEISNPGVQAAVDVGLVEPWSAEAPRLYDTAARASGETVSLRLGFRTVEIVGDRLLINHRPVVFRGVNRHETNPIRGRVYERENALADMRLMKQHNVNAIRTSHYPPHPEVLELADELGFWVIDECDLETHGFVFVGWRGNPSDDPRFEAVYLDRIERTVERDKNHPCVIIWSLGNEAGTGRNLELMTHWVHGRDPERPVHYEGDYRARYTDIYSRMYPNLEQVRAIAGSSGAVPNTGPGDAVRVRTKPLILCEYAHAMGNGPGAFADYDELVEEFPRYHGGFVWEWRDHGLLTHTGDGTAYYGYGGDFGEVVHDGNFVMDGLVLPDGTPTPSLAEFAAVNAPIVFSSHGGRLTVRSRFHSRTTAGLQFWAAVEVEGNQQARADLVVPAVEPGGSVEVDLPPDLAPAGGGEAWLTVSAALAEATPWAPAEHVIAWQQFPLAETATTAPQLPPPPARPTTVDDVVLGPARFRGQDGALLSLHGVEVSGPHVELWRGPTDNDRSGERGSFELGDPADTGGEGLPGPSSDRRWRDRGLHRLVTRVLDVRADTDRLIVRSRVGAANSDLSVEVAYHWWLSAEEEPALIVEVSPSPGWDCTWPRVSVRFDLPAAFQAADWYGTGPLESYPDSRCAARVGRYSADIDELNVRYSRPQETGHRSAVRDLVVRASDGRALRLVTWPDDSGHLPGFTLTRDTPHALDRALHPYELDALRDPNHVYLYLDGAVHGLGSRSCGIDVLPQHALWPSVRRFGCRFPAATGGEG
jgi:beta-galactosidase